PGDWLWDRLRAAFPLGHRHWMHAQALRELKLREPEPSTKANEFTRRHERRLTFKVRHVKRNGRPRDALSFGLVFSPDDAMHTPRPLSKGADDVWKDIAELLQTPAFLVALGLGLLEIVLIVLGVLVGIWVVVRVVRSAWRQQHAMQCAVPRSATR